MPSGAKRITTRTIREKNARATAGGAARAGAAPDQRSGMGSALGTGTAVTLFCGLPSISLSL